MPFFNILDYSYQKSNTRSSTDLLDGAKFYDPEAFMDYIDFGILYSNESNESTPTKFNKQTTRRHHGTTTPPHSGYRLTAVGQLLLPVGISIIINCHRLCLLKNLLDNLTRLCPSLARCTTAAAVGLAVYAPVPLLVQPTCFCPWRCAEVCMQPGSSVLVSQLRRFF